MNNIHNNRCCYFNVNSYHIINNDQKINLNEFGEKKGQFQSLHCLGIIHVDSSLFTNIFVCTSNLGKISVFRSDGSTHLALNALLFVHNPIMSKLITSQMLCATISNDKLIIWSISNSMILKVIENKSITTVTADEENNSILLGLNKRLIEYSFQGEKIREIKLKAGVQSICVLGGSFSLEKRKIVVGHKNGVIDIIKNKENELLIEKSYQLNNPIQQIEYRYHSDSLHYSSRSIY